MRAANDSFRLETDAKPLVFSLVQSRVQFQFLLSFWFSLDKVLLLFADDKDRTRRRSHHALSRAADAQMPPTRIAVGRDHDKIDVQILGRFGDLVGCMPTAHR